MQMFSSAASDPLASVAASAVHRLFPQAVTRVSAREHRLYHRRLVLSAKAWAKKNGWENQEPTAYELREIMLLLGERQWRHEERMILAVRRVALRHLSVPVASAGRTTRRPGTRSSRARSR